MIKTLLLLTSLLIPPPESKETVGYDFVEGHISSTIKFRSHKNLIIVPAVLNDTLTLNLILDTGIRSLALFSEKCQKLRNLKKGYSAKAGGRGLREAVNYSLSYPNKIKIGEIVGQGVGAAILSNSDLIKAAPGIDGIIGYELFVRFCIQIDYGAKVITLLNEAPTNACDQYTCVNLDLKNLFPEIRTDIYLSGKNKKTNFRTLIDTGSSFGLLIYKSKSKYETFVEVDEQIGVGLAGHITGKPLGFTPFEINDKNFIAHDSYSIQTNGSDELFASIGGEFLKNYVVMFDYPNSKFYIKPVRQ